MSARHALLIAAAALTIAACAPRPERSTITELDQTTCRVLVVEAGRLREVPCG